MPLFVRVVKELAHTSTFKSQKVDLRKQGYGGTSGEGDEEAEKIEDPIYVLSGRDEGYVEFYDEYPKEVAAGKKPKTSDFGSAAVTPRFRWPAQSTSSRRRSSC